MKRSISFILLTVLFFSCKKNDPDHDQGNNFIGFIYTSTNATSGNSIIALGRHRNGTVEELKGSPYATGARGDAAEETLTPSGHYESLAIICWP